MIDRTSHHHAYIKKDKDGGKKADEENKEMCAKDEGLKKYEYKVYWWYLQCYGINFVECITHTFMIKDMIIDDIFLDCHLMDENLSSNAIIPKQNKIHIVLVVQYKYLIYDRYKRCKLPQWSWGKCLFFDIFGKF